MIVLCSREWSLVYNCFEVEGVVSWLGLEEIRAVSWFGGYDYSFIRIIWGVLLVFRGLGLGEIVS